METKKAPNHMEFRLKKTKNFVSFSQNGIKIPENLSRNIIKGKISTHLARKRLFKEKDDYFFKFETDYELQTSYSLRKRKFTIKFVSRTGIPILKFRNLEYEEYKEIRQILEETNAVNTAEIIEVENLAHEHNHNMIIYGYIFWAAFSMFAFLAGIGLYEYLSGNERVVIEIYTAITIGSLVYNTLMCFIVGLKGDPSDIKKLRRHLVLQYIEGIFVVLVILIVFTFALTR